MSKKVIVVFDIGKTHKKVLLFDEQLKMVYQNEKKLPTTIDEDGFECDDIELIEDWLLSILFKLIQDKSYDVKAVNFSTYGASLAFLDNEGKRLTPIYNYLKEIDSSIQNQLFEKHGGQVEFSRKTASPSLGLMLNSGLQIVWLKNTKPELYARVTSVLHFPQYLSYLLTKNIVSESTSIGCHTFMWDFDNNNYHKWLSDEKIVLPKPLPNTYTHTITYKGHQLAAGIGIHDSSASLVPYLRGCEDPFLLVSTGTWCINMNPFNHSPLTEEQLKKDCLSFLSIDQNPVKSSRLFMGYIHDVNVNRLVKHFNVPSDSFKKVKTNKSLLKSYHNHSSEQKIFFKKGIAVDYIDMDCDLSQFLNFDEAYHRMMYDLTLLNADSIALITEPNDGVKNIYISGGFARNEIFVLTLAFLYPDKRVFTSEVDNSSAFGAALVVWDALTEKEELPEIDLGLTEWKSII